jgi:hypothetical protein
MLVNNHIRVLPDRGHGYVTDYTVFPKGHTAFIAKHFNCPVVAMLDQVFNRPDNTLSVVIANVDHRISSICGRGCLFSRSAPCSAPLRGHSIFGKS